jgi:hypothetical protein
MSNPYYGATGAPVAAARGISSSIRNEFTLIQTGFDGTNTAINAKGAITGQTWTGTHDFTGGSIRVPTLTYGTTGSFAVSMDTLNAAVFAAANLPAQAGKSGASLTTNGTIPSWSYLGLVLLATLTPTASAAVNALAVFNSTYDSYLIIGAGIAPSADDSVIFRVANAGTLDTATNYSNSGNFSTATTAYGAAIGNILTGSMGAAGRGLNFLIQVDNANDTTGLKTLSVRAGYENTVANTYQQAMLSTAYKGGVITGIGFFWSGASNFKAQGSIRIYGIQKA